MNIWNGLKNKKNISGHFKHQSVCIVNFFLRKIWLKIWKYIVDASYGKNKKNVLLIRKSLLKKGNVFNVNFKNKRKYAKRIKVVTL